MVVSAKRLGCPWHRQSCRGTGDLGRVHTGHDLGENRRGVVHRRARMARPDSEIQFEDTLFDALLTAFAHYANRNSDLNWTAVA
jgi:hypothetical protein